jgi:glutamate N-acetyltransferase/amino-acid N-acetyltransferase
VSVTAAKGFVASGVHAGIRASKLDLAIVRSVPEATGAAMWTVNRVQAAPVKVSREHLELAQPQAIVINSGVANAATGQRGELDARATAAEAARLLGLHAEEIVVLSTGVIGAPLPLDKVLPGLSQASGALTEDGGSAAAEAIMTTDTRPKQAAVQGPGFTVGGMAKGSGMIHPNLATMLAVVTTDYPLHPGEAIEFLKPAVGESFNAITVDGDCSTNDAVCLLANGLSGVERNLDSDLAFAAALRGVCADLAQQIVADGEGATVLAEIIVTAASDGGARARPPHRHVAAREDRLFGHDAN